MIGQLTLEERGSGKPRREELYGLPVLRAGADPEGWLGERRLRRAGRALHRGGIVRALAPEQFGRWEVLRACGLSPVDPVPFLRAQCTPLTLEALERRGLDPERAVVALRGLRADREMVRAAVELCPRVRRLVISAPRGGRELAAWLRREFGVPILPEEERAPVAVRFHPAGERAEETGLALYGPHPDLAGLTVQAPALAREDRAHLPLLAVLWEEGRLERGGLKIT